MIKSQSAQAVLIFRTNIDHPEKVEYVRRALKTNVGIEKISVDIEDIDHVLRIQGSGIAVEEVNELLHRAGFLCEELPD